MIVFVDDCQDAQRNLHFLLAGRVPPRLQDGDDAGRRVDGVQHVHGPVVEHRHAEHAGLAHAHRALHPLLDRLRFNLVDLCFREFVGLRIRLLTGGINATVSTCGAACASGRHCDG